MKKILYMLLLVQGGLMAQTKTFITVNGEKVQINPNSLNTADNGLTGASGKVQLGGALLKPTSLVTTSAYTLAIEGLQLGGSTDKILVADANGVLKWIDRSSLPGDNLGNHTATQDLNMSSKNITNIFNAYVKNDLQIADRTAGNTNYFGLYKNNGIFGIWNNSKAGNDLQIDEATRKTGVNNLSISKGTDGSVPAAGSLATSLDANGNVVWKSPASVIAANQVQADWNMATTTDPSYIKNKPTIPAPDNLGNHTATQDLNMSSKNITAANNITAAGTVAAANVTASTKATAQTAAITKGTDGSTPAAGYVATSVDALGNIKWTDPLTLAVSGDNLGNHTATQDLNMNAKNITAAANITATGTVAAANVTASTKATAQTAAITKGTDGSVPAAGSLATSLDASGNVVWKSPASVIAANQAQADWNMATTTDPSYIKNKPVIPVVTGAETKITAGTNVTVTGTGATGTPYIINATSVADNLGNHTATQDLNMSSKNITNIFNAYVKNDLQIADRVAGNTNYFGLYKSNGIFGIWNNSKSGNDLQIDEATRKTGVNNLSISKGTDGSVPAAGSLATSLDANGNVVWKSPASVIAANQVQADWNMATTTDPSYIKNKPTIPAPDNLGNHTATQDLNMSSKNITAANNITAAGTVVAANVTASTKATAQTAAITKGTDGSTPAAGYVATSVDALGNIKWSDPSTLAVSGDNLGNHTATQDLNMNAKNITAAANITATGTVAAANVTASTKATAQTAAITKGTDGSVPAAGSLATSLDASGNVVWKSPASVIAANQAQADWNMATTTDPSYIKNKPAIPVVTGAETKITAGTNVTVTGTGATGTPYVINATSVADNLGNHTATQDLNMSSKNITNINNAYVKNDLQILDRVAANTNYFGLYKNNGILGIWNNSKSGNDLQIDEATRKTGVNNLSISKGTDGSVPAAGSLATSLDASGNVVWKSPASVIAANQAQADWNMATTTDPSYIKNKPVIPVVTGAETKITAGTNVTVTGTGATGTPYIINATSVADNLGNHTATQDLNMNAKNITAAANITATGTVAAANVTASTKATAQTAAITKGTDGSTPAAGMVAMAADANGNIKWANIPTGAEPWFSTATDAGATSNTDNMYTNGWVGIGFNRPSAAPNEKLRVNGAITTVNSYYADYVFEDYFKGFSDIKADYKFKSLSDVDAFIKANKHLPGITPINELEKTSEGYSFNVSELSIQLLEKTEELYLHVIEQEKQLEAKDNEIKSLNERLEKLEKIVLDKK